MAPAMTAAASAELVAVLGRDADRTETFARRHGARRSYTDLGAFLADPEIDAVYVATPVDEHCAEVVAAARAGREILCEKPLARTSGECRTMIEAGRVAGVGLWTCFYQRYNVRHREIRRLLGEGRIGQVTSVRVNFSSRSPENPGAWRQDPGTVRRRIVHGHRRPFHRPAAVPVRGGARGRGGRRHAGRDLPRRGHGAAPCCGWTAESRPSSPRTGARTTPRIPADLGAGDRRHGRRDRVVADAREVLARRAHRRDEPTAKERTDELVRVHARGVPRRRRAPSRRQPAGRRSPARMASPHSGSWKPSTNRRGPDRGSCSHERSAAVDRVLLRRAARAQRSDEPVRESARGRADEAGARRFRSRRATTRRSSRRTRPNSTSCTCTGRRTSTTGRTASRPRRSCTS